MENTYLVELLKTLTPEERAELSLFVASPYHNRGSTSKDLQALLTILLDAAPAFDPVRLEKEKVYGALFPDKPLIGGKMEKLISDLHKLVRSFLITQRYYKAPNQTQQLLDTAAELRSRGLDTRYQQVIDQLKKALNSQTGEVPEHSHQRFLLEFEIHRWQGTFNRAKGDINLAETIRSLDIYYLLYRIELQNKLLIQKHLTQLDIPEEITFTWVDKSISPVYLSSSVLLMLTQKIYQLLSDPQPSVDAFHELILLLQQHEMEIDPEELKQFYAYLRNYCTILGNNGVDPMTQTLHQLQKDNLKRGYLYYEGKIPPSAYLNISRMAIMAGQVDWAEAFILSHRRLVLGQNEKEEFYLLNLATCLFAKGQFTQALSILPLDVPHTDCLLVSRRLELKIYYETNSELLPYKIDSFRMFISRASHKFLSPLLRELNTNFLNLLQQITLSVRGDKARSERLLRRIREKQSVAEREWLIQKAQELGQEPGLLARTGPARKEK